MAEAASMRFAWQGLQRLVLGSTRSPRLFVLIFHQVLRAKDTFRPHEPVAAEFDGLMKFLARNFRVRPLIDAAIDIATGQADSHAVAITFDDGYANNLEVAQPILQRYGLPATFFVASEPVETGIMWNDRLLHAIRHTSHDTLDLTELELGRFETDNDRNKFLTFRSLIPQLKYLESERRLHALKRIEAAAEVSPSPRLMLTPGQVRELADDRLSEIGGHTVSHPILARLPDSEAEREIGTGKEAVESMAGRSLRCFAYPNGVPNRDFTMSHVRMARRLGYELAVTTSVGGFRQGADLFEIPRIKPWDKVPYRFGVRSLVAARRNGEATIE